MKPSQRQPKLKSPSQQSDQTLSFINDSSIKKHSEHGSKKPTFRFNKDQMPSKSFLRSKKIEAKIERIITLRKEIKDDYIRSMTRKNVLPKWKEVIGILQSIDIKLMLIAVKCLGDIYMEFDDYEASRTLYSFYKIISFKLELFEECLLAYESLGNVYKFLYQHEKAIKCYKKMIEMAWILGNRNVELRAYDNIGIEYFYLCDKAKAKYYHERFLYGKFEKDTKLKESVLESFRNKHYNLFDDDKRLIRNVYTNDELKESVVRHIMMYENNRKIDFDNYDLLKNQDLMKNSFISNVEMSFQVIQENYLENDYLNNEAEEKKRDKYEKYIKKKVDSAYSSSSRIIEQERGQNDIILSHLSTKRKDYSNERFEKIFFRFDRCFNEFIKKNNNNIGENNK